MDYIRSRKILKDKVNDIPELKDIGKATWSFVSFIYKSEWVLYPKLQNMSETCLTLIQHQIPADI